jgi:hypothetical protein
MKPFSSAGRQALADFFGAMVTQKAHWYCLSVLPASDATNVEVNQIFPLLSTLLSVEPGLMLSMLQLSGLAQLRRGKVSISIKTWTEFIAEKRLDIEITTFSVVNRRYNFIRVGSWNKDRHPPQLPLQLWRDKISPPKLRISGLTRAFAECVGRLDLADSALFEDNELGKHEDLEVEEALEDGKDLEEYDGQKRKADCGIDAFYTQRNLPDPTKFPLLHSLGVCTTSHMDRLLQEIVQLYGGKSISYTRGNNRKGTLVVVPSNRTLERYEEDFSKPGSALETMIGSLANSTASTPEDAASCLLSVLFSKYEESFVSVSMEKGLVEGSTMHKKMDIVATEAMLQEANINNSNARILFRHLRQFFGKSYFESEQKRRSFFGDNDFPPTVDKTVLEDKTVVPFWYKRPDLLLQSQLSKMIDTSKLGNVRQVDLIVGGDHGGGKFRMTLKVNFRMEDKSTVSVLIQLASVSFSKDDTEILKATVLEPIGRGLQLITEGGKFIVDDKLTLSFSDVDNPSLLCSCSTKVYLVGDLKFYAQMAGREGMSSYWCMWCALHPSEWRSFRENPNAVAAEDRKLWTIELHTETLRRINSGELKEAKEKKGVVGDAIWPFIEPCNFIFPHLHFEIGVVNMVLENFYSFIEEQVELISPEEKVTRNSIIISEVSIEQAKERVEQWHMESDPILARHRLEKSYMVSALKDRTLTIEQRNAISVGKEQKETIITQMVAQRKALEKDLSLKKKALADRRKDLQGIQRKKKKIDFPVSADIENILKEYNISAAAYHGGKLNGVDCRELLRLTKDFFPRFEEQLLAVEHPDRCSSSTITDTCKVHNDLLATLDLISSKIRLKYNEPQPEDYDILERALDNLDYLWKIANLSYTPKIHSILVHAVEQMWRCEGIGDMLEDDVEHIHQMAARIESRTSRMTNKALQPFLHSKIEAIQNSHVIKQQIQSSQDNAKRASKERDPEADSFIRNKKLRPNEIK